MRNNIPPSGKKGVRQLYIEKIVGIISAEDESYFQNLLDSDVHARYEYEQLELENNKIGTLRFVNNINEYKDLVVVKSSIKNNPKRKPYSSLRWVSAAVFLFFITIAGLIFLEGNKNDVDKLTDENQIMESLSANKVQLQLGNGNSVLLDNKDLDHTIVIGEVQLTTSGNLLQSAIGEHSYQLNTLIVPAKEDYKIVLADGTKVWINSKTRFQFPFSFGKDSREVYLDGEAFFEVAKDTEKPFIVHALQTDIQVHGTSFNVNTYNRKLIKTSLLEGKVSLKSFDGKLVDLKPGYEAGFDIVKGFSLNQFDASTVLSWMDGVAYFHNEPLSTIGEIIHRWFDIKVIFDSPETSNFLISGLLEKGQLEGFLKDLKTSTKIKYYYSGNTLHFH